MALCLSCYGMNWHAIQDNEIKCYHAQTACKKQPVKMNVSSFGLPPPFEGEGTWLLKYSMKYYLMIIENKDMSNWSSAMFFLQKVFAQSFWVNKWLSGVSILNFLTRDFFVVNFNLRMTQKNRIFEKQCVTTMF